MESREIILNFRILETDFERRHMEPAINQQIEIPEIVINDLNDFVTANKTIANIVIRGRHGERRMRFVRTRNCKYMMM